MNYKVYISGYIEETQQLLVSFSNDNTEREAIDYQSLAFDIVPYGDISTEEIVDAIAKTAPTICEDIVTQETYTNDSVKSQELRALVGQEFVYKDVELFPESYHRQASVFDTSEEL